MARDMKHISRMGVLIGKMKADVLTPGEEAELREWRDAAPENRALYDRWTEGAFLQENYGIFNGIDTDSAYGRMQERIRSDRRKGRRVWTYAAVAASVAILVTVGTLFFGGDRQTDELAASYVKPTAAPVLSFGDGREIDLRNSTIELRDGGIVIRGEDGASEVVTAGGAEETAYATIDVPAGHTYALTLDDGTTVRLNAESRLKYPVRFPADMRTVELSGEAYFEVAPESARKFRVTAHGTEVSVLGTVFNVEAYAPQQTRTTLVSGSVEVGNGVGRVVIRPGQTAVASPGAGIGVQDADLGITTAWTRNMFYFHEAPLEDIMQALSRWYGVGTVFGDEGLRGRRLSIEISRDAEIGRIMGIITDITSAKVEIKDNIVTIR